jgi:hypothetical protein
MAESMIDGLPSLAMAVFGIVMPIFGGLGVYRYGREGVGGVLSWLMLMIGVVTWGAFIRNGLAFQHQIAIMFVVLFFAGSMLTATAVGYAMMISRTPKELFLAFGATLIGVVLIYLSVSLHPFIGLPQ